MSSKYIASVQPEKRSKIYWAMNDSWLMTKRSITHIIRSFDQVMSLVLFPIMFMILNRYVFGGAIDTGDLSYANYLFAGILVQTLAFGANYTTINLAVDMKEGIIDRFKSLPMGNSALLTGHINADMVRNVISGVIIIIVGFIVGFRADGGRLSADIYPGYFLAISNLGADGKEFRSCTMGRIYNNIPANFYIQRLRATAHIAGTTEDFCGKPAAHACYRHYALASCWNFAR
jgi:hypothetical protein